MARLLEVAKPSALRDRAGALPDLNPDRLIKATRRLDRLTFRPGQPIVRQGGQADNFYIIARGTVEVIVEQPDGSERIVETLGEGQCFGEPALLSAGVRNATVRAAHTNGPVEVIVLDRSEFHALIAKAESVHADSERVAEQRTRA